MSQRYFLRIALSILMLSAATVACKKKAPGPGGGTPTPTPGATATPNPTGTPGVPYPGLPNSCQNLPNRTSGGPTQDYWDDSKYPGGAMAYSWDYLDDLQDAISNVPRNPPIFNQYGEVPMEKRAEYAKLLSQYLDQRGVCALFDGHSAMYLRTSARDYNETIEVFKYQNNTSEPKAYPHFKNEPADRMPGAPIAIPEPPQGCSNPNGFPAGWTGPTTPCNKQGSGNGPFRADLENAMLEVFAEEKAKSSSLIFDFRYSVLTPTSGWEDKGVMIKDNTYFLNSVAKKMTAKGYCYQHNAYDVILLKKDKSHSEDWDIVYAHSCGEPGQPTCRPSAPAGQYMRFPGGGWCEAAEF